MHACAHTYAHGQMAVFLFQECDESWSRDRVRRLQLQKSPTPELDAEPALLPVASRIHASVAASGLAAKRLARNGGAKLPSEMDKLMHEMEAILNYSVTQRDESSADAEAEALRSIEIGAAEAAADAKAAVALAREEEAVAIEAMTQAAAEKFAELDVDGSGKLDIDELGALAEWVWGTFHPGQKIKPQQREAEARKLLHRCDKDGDGGMHAHTHARTQGRLWRHTNLLMQYLHGHALHTLAHRCG